ncbi:hypothetical protein [Albidovulum aquaemixtae]|uniref:hypothetical protein n=1 Tax=Albidovulum aquaemixtae TaxID=1542388 RepID=UPI000D558417|nr:hypothetical protein [Defluviimonas aquaemixtae]
MNRAAILVILSLVQPAFAEGWGMKSGDVVFTKAELSEFIAENEVRFYDGGHSEYGPDDAYAYVYEGGDRAEGRYRIEEDGSVCVDFRNGWSRCDLYVRNGGRVLLIDEKGDRYPLKPAG